MLCVAVRLWDGWRPRGGCWGVADCRPATGGKGGRAWVHWGWGWRVAGYRRKVRCAGHEVDGPAAEEGDLPGDDEGNE